MKSTAKKSTAKKSTTEKSTTKRVPRSRCPRCKADGNETYWYMAKKYLFDVDLAREIVADGREPAEIDSDDVRYSVVSSVIDDFHVPHVDASIPGIISHVFFTQEDGEVAHGHVLIDGNHRAARALQLDKPFFAYILSRAESRRILLRKPPARRRTKPGTCR